jgi:hypothetical protein
MCRGIHRGTPGGPLRKIYMVRGVSTSLRNQLGTNNDVEYDNPLTQFGQFEDNDVTAP